MWKNTQIVSYGNLVHYYILDITLELEELKY